MRNRLGKLAVAFGLVACMSAPAWAQGQGRGFGMFGGGINILRAPNLQKELKLTDAQIEKIQPTLQEISGKYRDEMTALRDLEPAERGTKMRELTGKMVAEAKKELAFTPDQEKRFDQVSLQARRLQAFSDPKVAEKLKITDDQKTKIQELSTSVREQMTQIFQDASGDREAAMKKMTELNKESWGKATALLTDDQKKAWKELTGEPFEVQMPPRPNN